MQRVYTACAAKYRMLISLFLYFPSIAQCIVLGAVSSIEVNHKNVETARKGQEVCIKIENTGGDAPKMYGRHFDSQDILISRVSHTRLYF